MEHFIAFFEEIPTWFRAGLLYGGIVFFWFIEGWVPLHSFKYKKLGHALTNVLLTLINSFIALSLAFVLVKITEFTAEKQFGLLYIFDLPLWLNVILGVMMLDLVGAYFIHWTEHKVKWMWKFHLIHHTDMHVDVTTGLRHHPGEMLFRISFTWLAASVSGAGIGTIILYQSLSVLFTHLTHANLNIPDKIDKVISLILVSPNMHKIHHHYKLPLTDTNYGNIFSIWDRIFGTFRYVNARELVYGIDTHMDQKETQNMGELLKIPFTPYRPPSGEDAKFS